MTIEELQAENNRLANRVDDLEHDFGVLSFCGTAINKQDIEGLRTELSGEVVTILQAARARIDRLKEHLDNCLKYTAQASEEEVGPVVITLTEAQLKELKIAIDHLFGKDDQ